MYCLDANIWVYYLDSNLPEHEAVVESVRSLLKDHPLFTTTVLQMEVIHYLKHQLDNSPPTIERFLTLEDVTVAELTTDDVRAAVDMLELSDAGIGGRDATVIAAMNRHGVTTLWTHDRGLKRFGDQLDWLTVADPVESGTDSLL